MYVYCVSTMVNDRQGFDFPPTPVPPYSRPIEAYLRYYAAYHRQCNNSEPMNCCERAIGGEGYQCVYNSRITSSFIRPKSAWAIGGRC